MIPQLNQHVVNSRLELLQQHSRAAQLKRVGYRENREPRISRHWANR
ncbi:MAG TPA: hypothetical protein VF168_12125 [Trueperaceae bacterium]